MPGVLFTLQVIARSSLDIQSYLWIANNQSMDVLMYTERQKERPNFRFDFCCTDVLSLKFIYTRECT